MITITEIKTKKDLADFLAHNKEELHVIKFGAEWCGPCKLLETRLKNLDESKIGNTLFCEVTIDDDESEQSEIAREYGISQVPVLIFIKNEELVNRSFGAIGTEAIYERIKFYGNNEGGEQQ